MVEPADESAGAWVAACIEGRVSVRIPELAYAEVSSALVKYVRAGELTADDGDEALDFVLSLPLAVDPVRRISRAAYAIAVSRRLSAYDAYYVALADGHSAILVTADSRLADQAQRSALLPGTGPPS